MLVSLHIRNFAIIDTLDLELHGGLSVVTGETGAGKSILVDALALALGERATGTVRDGERRTEVSACFDLGAHSEARDWLQARELESPDECLVRRVIGTDGRSRAFVNGSPVGLQDLKALGDLLVDIHGQHAHHALLKPAVQRELLDQFGGHGALVTAVREAHQRCRGLEEALREVGGDAAHRSAELELLRFQIDELEELAVTAGETRTLEEEHRRLANAERLRDSAGSAHESLYGDHDGAALTLLESAVKQLAELAQTDAALAPVHDQLKEAAIQLAEGDRELRHYVEGVTLDPERLQAVERRLDAIHQAARKHQAAANELPALLEELRARHGRLEHSGERRRELAAELNEAREDYDRAVAALSQARRDAAGPLARAVTADIQRLGIGQGSIEVAVTPLPDGQGGAHGRDRVELLVTTNPGRPAGPLAKIASGGELSRISLAIQVVGSRDHGIPTVVFDEVDVGIGGGVAETVGGQLRALAASRQVLCVTHLPQVASHGEHHLQVVKTAANGATVIRVEALGREERVEEVARMLGGMEITRQSRAHAREMIERYAGG